MARSAGRQGPLQIKCAAEVAGGRRRMLLCVVCCRDSSLHACFMSWKDGEKQGVAMPAQYAAVAGGGLRQAAAGGASAAAAACPFLCLPAASLPAWLEDPLLAGLDCFAMLMMLQISIIRHAGALQVAPRAALLPLCHSSLPSATPGQPA